MSGLEVTWPANAACAACAIGIIKRTILEQESRLAVQRYLVVLFFKGYLTVRGLDLRTMKFAVLPGSTLAIENLPSPMAKVSKRCAVKNFTMRLLKPLLNQRHERFSR